VNPIGVTTWLWTSPLSDAELDRLVPLVSGWGFDVIELPIEQPGDWDPVRTAELVARAGLGTTTCAVMTPDRDLTTTDPAVTGSTQDYLRQCIDIAAVVGSPIVAGPIYAPVARLWPLDADDRRLTVARLVEALRAVADHAERRGVRLALEPLNRYETSLVNTVEQAMEVVDGVGSPALGVLLDTFHMNIEERSIGDAIRAAGKRVIQLHTCENDRGAPGSGHVPWREVSDACRDIGFKGPYVIESFTDKVKSIARAAAIWRNFAPTQDALAEGGLRFLRETLPD
jgi:D-psicose/D-tagatose/L-ribulose 3-epimerase